MRKQKKKYLLLLTILWVLTTAGCVSNKDAEEVILPPEPQREELPEIESLAETGKIINYYEHLVQEWETWGKDVKRIIYKNSSQPE